MATTCSKALDRRKTILQRCRPERSMQKASPARRGAAQEENQTQVLRSPAEQGVPGAACELPPRFGCSPQSEQHIAGETTPPALCKPLVTEPLPSNTQPVQVSHCPHLLGNTDAENLEQQPVHGYGGLFSFCIGNAHHHLVQADNAGRNRKSFQNVSKHLIFK